MSDFEYFILIGFITNYFTCFHNIFKMKSIKHIKKFTILLQFHTKTWKTKHWLLLLCLIYLWMYFRRFGIHIMYAKPYIHLIEFYVHNNKEKSRISWIKCQQKVQEDYRIQVIIIQHRHLFLVEFNSFCSLNTIF